VATDALAVVRACLKAYIDKDRNAIEALLASDYHFTSPIDNALDRAAYFTICWPNSKALKSFDVICQAENRGRAFVVYEGETLAGKRFRNCEVHTVRDGKLVSTEVYFGWNVPHNVPVGRHLDHDGEGDA
jgi:ketosteroid isomerase-like protein